MISAWAAVAWAGVVADGAAAFQEGKLEEATHLWEAGVGASPSGVLLYDLGTVWYRRGDAARSIAYLRGALRLRPRDGSVHHNLALARAELGVVPPPAESAVPWSLVVTPGELGLFGVLLAGVGSLMVGAGLRRDSWTAPGIAALVLGVGVGAVASAGAWQLQWHPVAVVVDQPAALRDAASPRASELGALPVGSEVRVDRRYGGFLLVEDGRGKRGWLPDGAVQLPHAFP
jgi:tetratricopeptide (TPR) repeat protein